MVRSATDAHPYSTRAIGRDDADEQADLLRRMWTHADFASDELPARMVRVGWDKIERSILSAGFTLLDQRAAAIFAKHDLGAGFLWEISVVGPDGAPLFEAPWFGLHVGAVKKSLDLEASDGVKTMFGNRTLDTHPIETGAKRLVLASNAAEGADVWAEASLIGLPFFFVSTRLVEALEAAGIAADFDFVACAAT